MDLKRWKKREDLKEELRDFLMTNCMVEAMSLIRHENSPSIAIKGMAADYVTNAALTHAFQAGVHHALNRLLELPNAQNLEPLSEEKSWGHKEEASLSKDNPK